VTAGYTHRVDFERRFVEGALRGLTVPDSLSFCSKTAALFYAKRDGLTLTPYGGGAYVQQNSKVITLPHIFELSNEVQP